MRKLFLAFKVLLVIMLIALICGMVFILPVINGSQPREPVSVQIHPGMTVKEISQMLDEKGIAPYPELFYLATVYWNVDKNIVAGEYKFTTGMPYSDVLKILTKGPDIKLHKMVIPEGFTNKQVYERLAGLKITDAELFNELISNNGTRYFGYYDILSGNSYPSLEGYLFPKTYILKDNPDPEEIIHLFLKQFEEEAGALLETYEINPQMTLHQIITIASLIEREARLPEERPVIAGVIYNRLSRNMELQIDATVQYALGKNKKLTWKDLEVVSPYNTYLYKGLPPGPICNPGADSIKAALNPARHSYLYYVLFDKDGHHKFTTTWKEFDAAKRDAKRRKVY